MSLCLLISGRTGSRYPMRGRFLSMLLAIAILFGSLVAPETAHAERLPAAHGAEVLSEHVHADFSDQKDEQEKGSAPCHALVHHHCSISLAAEADVCSLPVWNTEAALLALVVQPMPSLTLAPPSEPPTA